MVSTWFSGIDAVFDLIFFLITGLVAYSAFKGYRLLGTRQARLLATGFALISVSYLALSLGNLLSGIMIRDPSFGVRYVIIATNLGWFSHSLLFLTGLLVLVALYYKLFDVGLQLLLFFLTIFGFLLSGHLTSGFYALTAVLLLAIIAKIWHRKKVSKLILGGFILLFLGEMILSLAFLGTTVYVLGHVVALAGFVSILIRQVQVMR